MHCICLLLTQSDISDLIIHPFPETETAYWVRVSGSCDDRSGLSGLARSGGLVRRRAGTRWRTRFDTNRLGSLYGLRRLLDREMQHTFVEMSYNGSIFGLERQQHRSIE